MSRPGAGSSFISVLVAFAVGAICYEMTWPATAIMASLSAGITVLATAHIVSRVIGSLRKTGRTGLAGPAQVLGSLAAAFAIWSLAGMSMIGGSDHVSRAMDGLAAPMAGQLSIEVPHFVAAVNVAAASVGVEDVATGPEPGSHNDRRRQRRMAFTPPPLGDFAPERNGRAGIVSSPAVAVLAVEVGAQVDAAGDQELSTRLKPERRKARGTSSGSRTTRGLSARKQARVALAVRQVNAMRAVGVVAPRTSRISSERN